MAHRPLLRVIQPSLEGIKYELNKCLIVYTVFLSLPSWRLVTPTLLSHVCLIWILIGPISAAATKVWVRSAYLTVGSSEGTEEEQEPLDRSLASSCSPGPVVAKALFDVIHLRGWPLIVSASGTPWPPPTLHTDDSDKWAYKRIHLTPSDHIHICYETTQEQKTPKATSRCT